MIEFWFSVIGLLVIFGFAWIGVRFGAFYELTSAILLSLATWMALRYWYPLTVWLAPWFGREPVYAALLAYWVLFLVGTPPLVALMSRVTIHSRPRYPRLLDSVVGFIGGGIAGAIVVCAVMTSASVVVPRLWPAYERTQLVLPLDQLPIQVYQFVEENWVGIPAASPSHTRFPTFEKTDADNLRQYWR